MDILNFGNINAETYCTGMCCRGLVGYLATYKLPEDIHVQSTETKQVFYPTAKNRYIRSVVVEPIELTDLDVTPTTSVQTFTDGPYGTVTVQAAD